MKHMFVFLAVGSAAAQPPIVSPAGLANVAGNAPFLYTLEGAARYLQIHSDLGPQALLIGKLAFRQIAGTGIGTGVRTMDMELWLGESRRYDQVSPAFADNFVRAPANVIARRLVNLGPQGAQGNPSPFVGMDLTFDSPFIYTANNVSLAWDLRVFGGGVGGGGWNNVDAHTCPNASAVSTATGDGCPSMRQGEPLVRDCGGTLAALFSCFGAPVQQPTVLALGLHNPNLAVPGLCSPLQTDLTVLMSVGPTNRSGGIATLDGTAFLLMPNILGGVALYSQFHTFDSTQSGIPIRNSSGMRFVVPAANPAAAVRVSNIYDRLDPNAVRSARFGIQGFIGAGVVTQFAP